MSVLKIITSTTREGRKGISVANWITAFAKQVDGFEVDLIDLKELDLPFMNEPNHPSLGKYQYEHTKNFSKIIGEADAFIIVLAEYNYGFPAPIKNAIDYLHKEWQYKPVGIVSYGGVSGGLRSSQMLKQVVTTLNMMPIPTQVTIPFFAKFIDKEEIFNANDIITDSAVLMLQELLKWSDTMKTMRVTG